MNKELIIKEIWEANDKSMIIDYMDKIAHQQGGIEKMQDDYTRVEECLEMNNIVLPEDISIEDLLTYKFDFNDVIVV
jgi:hypothetical protein